MLTPPTTAVGRKSVSSSRSSGTWSISSVSSMEFEDPTLAWGPRNATPPQDLEPLTPNGATSEGSSQIDDGEMTSHGSPISPESKTGFQSAVGAERHSDSYASVLTQQTIFQNLTFDLLYNSAVGIDLDWNVLEELKGAAA